MTFSRKSWFLWILRFPPTGKVDKVVLDNTDPHAIIGICCRSELVLVSKLNKLNK